MKIPWNVVNLTGEASDVAIDKLRPKLDKLEKLLTHFPQDAVHLQITLDSRHNDKTYRVVLNLRVPSDVLHVSKESSSMVAAFDESVNTLIRRLKRLKARYRRDYMWKHRRAEPLPETGLRFAPVPLSESEGPQTYTETVVAVLKQDYARLLSFVARQLKEFSDSGTLPSRAIDPHDIVDHVAEEVLRHPGLKPESMDYHTWCTALAFRHTRKAVQRYADQANLDVRVDLDVSAEADAFGEDDMELEPFALNLIQAQLAPDETVVADTMSDPHIVSPATEVEHSDILLALRRISRSWPKVERDTFDLFFLEGLSAEAVAHAFGCDRSLIDQTVSQLRERLRTLLAAMSEVGHRVEPQPERAAAFAQRLETVAADVGPRDPGGGAA